MAALVQILPSSAALASSRLVDCKGCTECCEHGGLVYVSDHEVPVLTRIGVPLVQVEGVSFIKRLPDGSCPMLDREGRRCSIYEHRPLCCRLFPLDVLSVGGRLRWAVSHECPTNRTHFGGPQGPGSKIGLGTVARIAEVLDGLLDDEAVRFLRRKEQISSRLEVSMVPETPTWTSLLDCSEPRQLEATTQTKKEKLRRKLREKKKRKAKNKRKKT